MNNITIHSIESASAESQTMLESIANANEFIPNVFAAIAESSAALSGFVGLNSAFAQASFTEEQRQIIMLATSAENQCAYCVAGHSAFCKILGVDQTIVEDMRKGRMLVNPKLNALNVITRKLVQQRGQIMEKELTDFFDTGYSTAQFYELVSGIALKTFSNYVSKALNLPLDEAFKPYAWERPS